MGAIVLTVRFACELAALAVLGWFGYQAHGGGLAVTLVVAAGVLWGAFVAPKAARRLRDPWRFVVESVVWAGATASLVGLGQVAIAVVFAGIALATAVGARRYEPRIVKR